MRVSARVRANRANAKRSTGPKTKAGKTRSALNAYKHGLSIPAGMVPECSPAVEAYVAELVGEGASAEIRAAAIAFGEAQADVDRVRRIRLELYKNGEARTKKMPASQKLKTAIGMLKIIDRINYIDSLEDDRPIYEFREALPAVAEFLSSFKLNPGTPTLEGGMTVLAPQLARLWRYERRALSRRRKAGERLRLLCSRAEDSCKD